MTVTNHGLSALTHAPADKRLQWPFKDGKTYPISTSFNDATSGAKYPQKSGHEGIDVASLSRPGLFPSLSIQGSARPVPADAVQHGLHLRRAAGR